MQKKITIIHTSFVSVNALKELFREIIPEALVTNIVDDSLLPEVMANGAITPGVVERICTYALQAQEMGADLIFNQCSSVGEAVDVARNMLRIPYIKIDEGMAETAVGLGGKIVVVSTVASTMGPSKRLLERTAVQLSKNVEISECLVDGALDLLLKEGDVDKHNHLVLQAIEQVASQNDVVVLAQGSMIVLLPHLTHIKIPILTSPRLGIERAKMLLGL